MDDTRKIALIAAKDTLDWAYPPFILAFFEFAGETDVCQFI